MNTAADVTRESVIAESIFEADTQELPPNLETVLRLPPESFQDPTVAQIIAAIRTVRDEGQDPVNEITVARLLRPDQVLRFAMFTEGKHAIGLDLAELEADTLLGRMKERGVKVNGEAVKPAEPWLQLVSDAADIITKELPPVVELVAGLIPEQSKVVIGSSAKSFKTWLSLDLALAISHGLAFLDRPTQRRRVLYVNLELKPQTFERRVQAIAKAKRISVERESFRHLPLRGKLSGVIVTDFVTRLIRMAKKFKIGVVFLDPVYKVNQAEENSSREQTAFFNELDRLTTDAGCAVVLNDHFSKGNKSETDPLDAIRGSSAKGGDVDAAIVLRNHEEKDCFRIDVVHRELPPVEAFCVGWRYPLMELRHDLDPDKMKKSKGGLAKQHDHLKLLAAIADTTAERPVSISAWAMKAGVKRQTLQDYLPAMRAKGWIRTSGEGNSARQFISKSGVEALEDQ